MDRYCCLWIFTFLLVACIFANDCNWNYYNYYKEKNCTAVLGANGCPEKFRCGPVDEQFWYLCFHDGKFYYPGETYDNVGTCVSCPCQDDENGAFATCWPDFCHLVEVENDSCTLGYKPQGCCPENICLHYDLDTIKYCTHLDRIYKVGDVMKTRDPCKICVCSAEFDGEEGCRDRNCFEPMFGYHIRNGCLPIFQETQCCFREMYCGEIYTRDPDVLIKSNIEDLCLYRGVYYERGAITYLSEDRNRETECLCTVPPDFTCVRMAPHPNMQK
ncbi:uncharacterized protein LOC118195972 [Stegodyphus dumicola]|uniref:uncharacterized protein LOC118195972 n=1 Tax=Stegodyphus dumicola TaxID=202533 RepID=UPI0015B1E995|nr:uncharacterized protein LOC118195972 [Stegodyphus dumicola]